MLTMPLSQMKVEDMSAMDANNDGTVTRSERREYEASTRSPKQEQAAKPVKKEAPSASLAFAPFRALGVVSTETPCVVTRRGGKSFVVTAVGRSFHIYDCARLRLQFVGSERPN